MQNRLHGQGQNLLTSEKASEYLAISERKLWGLTAPRGPLPCVKLGRSIRYKLKDLDAYINAQRVTAVAQGVQR